VDETIRRVIQEDANCCQVDAVPWDKIHDRLIDDSVPTVTIKRRSIICKVGYCLAAAVAIFGLLIISGFASPVVAGALEQVPVVGPAYDFFAQCAGLQGTTINDLGTRVNQVATDQGVTITITDLLYDQGRLAVGYMVTTERPDAAPPIPADWKTQYFYNGRVIRDPRQGTWQNIGHNLTGYEEIYPTGELPEAFNLRVAIHQIGDRRGSWLLTIPVSRQRIDAATKTVLPMQAVQIGQSAVMITKVTVGPASTTIDYDADESMGEVYFNATNDRGDDFRPVGGSLMGHRIEGGQKIRMLQEVLVSPQSVSKYLILTPCLSSASYPAEKLKIFLN
jgi:hypothetical protein